MDQVITNPEYSQTHKSDDGNIAVLLLHKDPSISPASLPRRGCTDKLRGEGVLNGRFSRRSVMAQPRLIKEVDHERSGIRHPQLCLLGLSCPCSGYLYLSMNPATDDGGTCWGDSWTKLFGYTEMIAALTVKGDAVCRATNVDYRFDTAAAHVFRPRQRYILSLF